MALGRLPDIVRRAIKRAPEVIGASTFLAISVEACSGRKSRESKLGTQHTDLTAVMYLIRKLGVPFVPGDERKDGVAFWRSLRAMPVTAGAVQAGIYKDTFSPLVAAEAARLSKLQGA